MAADNRVAWNAIAQSYQSLHRISTEDAHYGPRAPPESRLQLLGDVKGRLILEIGCGGAQCSIWFAKRGALVSAKDLSEEQLAFARELAARENVRIAFHHGTIEDLSEFGNGSQDIVFSAWALPFVEDFPRCVREVFRVLKPGGVFVFSYGHPFSYAITSSGPPWVVERRYWDVAREWHQDDDPARPLFREFARPIGELFQGLRDGGFVVDRILEPEPLEHPHDSWDESYPLARLRMVPATVIFRAVKPVASSGPVK